MFQQKVIKRFLVTLYCYYQSSEAALLLPARKVSCSLEGKSEQPSEPETFVNEALEREKEGERGREREREGEIGREEGKRGREGRRGGRAHATKECSLSSDAA